MENITLIKVKTLYNDLWDAITDMFVSDGIDYMNEKSTIRQTRLHNGDNMLTYKGEPYCVWDSGKVNFGDATANKVTVKAEITLRRLYKKPKP